MGVSLFVGGVLRFASSFGWGSVVLLLDCVWGGFGLFWLWCLILALV